MRLVDRLPLLAREQLREAVGVGAQRLGEAVEDPRAQLAVAPPAGLACGNGRADGVVDVRGARRRELGDELSRRRIRALEAVAARVDEGVFGSGEAQDLPRCAPGDGRCSGAHVHPPSRRRAGLDSPLGNP